MSAGGANSRLEAFADGVFAIALTLLVIELRAPLAKEITPTQTLWQALRHLLPEMFAFLLSFCIVFITWFNHHESLREVDKSSARFVYANGFMLLTIVLVPFPTALLGEHLFTPSAAPAVVLYSAMCALQGVGWLLMTHTALVPTPLTRNAQATAKMRKAHRDSYPAMAFYTVCAVVAVWLPTTAAVAITATWIGWLTYSIRLKAT